MLRPPEARIPARSEDEHLPSWKPTLVSTTSIMAGRKGAGKKGAAAEQPDPPHASAFQTQPQQQAAAAKPQRRTGREKQQPEAEPFGSAGEQPLLEDPVAGAALAAAAGAPRAQPKPLVSEDNAGFDDNYGAYVRC